MIPQQFIDDLLRRVDVVEVVGQYVQLKRAGANYSGLCPFHTEKSPSFTVSPAKQFYHCFGCGAHGSALGFLIEHLAMPFPQAVEDLARRVGLEVPKESPRVDPAVRQQQTDLRARLKDRLMEAAKFYMRRLKDSPQAVEYLKKRGLSGEIAARYHLGYSPAGWQSLQAVFGDYEHQDLIDAGLVVTGEGEKRYDRFRDRIMFPILSPRGEVLGFGARTLGADEPKYLNSPETPVFSKGDELYGVFEARQAIRDARQVWVVEGYMDVVALAQHGLGHAVATLGTATTAQHLKALLRLADHIVFMFDGDSAGQRAAVRALDTAMPFASEKNRIDFAFLPPEHDPDSFVREHGAKALTDFVAKAKPLSAFLLDVAAQDQSLEFPEGRAKATAEASTRLALMPANALRAQIIRETCRRFDVEERALLAQITAQGVATSRSEGFRGQAQGGTAQASTPATGAERPAMGSARARVAPPVIRPLAERLLQILVRSPEWSIEFPAELTTTLDDAQADLLAWIQARNSEGRTANLAVLHEAALAEGREKGSEAIRLFLRLSKPDAALDQLMDADPAQFRSEYLLAVNRLKVRALEEEAAALAAKAEGDASLLGRLAQIRAQIRELKA